MAHALLCVASNAEARPRTWCGWWIGQQRQIDADRRVTALEDDFRELKKGNGWISHQRAGVKGQYLGAG